MSKKIVVMVLIFSLVLVGIILFYPTPEEVLEDSDEIYEKIYEEVCEDKEVWILEESFWVEGNFSKDYDNFMRAGGGGGYAPVEPLRDDWGEPYTIKDNLDYSIFCKNGTEYTSGTIFYPRNGDKGSVQINCNKKTMEEVCGMVELDPSDCRYWELTGTGGCASNQSAENYWIGGNGGTG